MPGMEMLGCSDVGFQVLGYVGVGMQVMLGMWRLLGDVEVIGDTDDVGMLMFGADVGECKCYGGCS